MSVTCNDEGDPAIIAVTVIVDNNDDSKLCVVVVVSVVAGDVIVIVVDENYEGKFLTIVIVFAEYACKTIFSFSLFPGLPVVIGIDQGLTVLLLSRILYIALASCFSFVTAAYIVFDDLYADFILQINPESIRV